MRPTTRLIAFDRCRSFSTKTMMCLALLQAKPAAADGVPPDQCNMEGSSCANAGPTARAPGICAAARCTKYFPVYPDGSGAGGGPSFELHEYDCLRCVLEQPTDAGNEIVASDDSGCGCGLVGIPREVSLASIMACLGLLTLRAGRRR
jgi:hypothetical protein